jgi:hypothetical protein
MSPQPQTWPCLVSAGWRDELHAGLDCDDGSFRIICPLVKAAVLDELLDGRAVEHLQLVTRFRLADFCAGVSDIAALRRVIASGGRVRGVRGLHAKVYLFGATRAAVTSANLTSRGVGGNHEFGCVSEEPSFVAACASYFDALWQAAGTDLDAALLDAWRAQVDGFLNTGGRPARQPDLPDHGAQLPEELVGPAADVVEATEGWPAESDQTFVKFFGEGSNRVPWSHAVLDEVQRSGCHWACTYPASRRPRSVREGDTLFVGRLVKDPNDTLIFGRVIGRAHVPERDEATAAEIEKRPWKHQWPHYIRVHHGEFVAGELHNGVSLNALMDALGSDAFASTQHNARSQNGGNTNQRRAFRQHPAVRLTDEATAWLTAAIQQAFALHGRVHR